MNSVDANSIILLVVALANAGSAYFAWKAKNIAMKTQNDIRLLEKNTNSIKDALVARTAEASEAKGRDDERAIGEAKAKNLIRNPHKRGK